MLMGKSCRSLKLTTVSLRDLIIFFGRRSEERMNHMEKEIVYLKEKIEFLETLLEVNSGTLEKVIETNRTLIEELKKRAI